MFFYVYPFICATNGTTPPPTLLGDGGCVNNLRLQPTYQPPLIPPYSPNFGRLTCNLILFINPNGTCIFTSDPLTGDIIVTSSEGSITIPTLPATTLPAT
jgi:hypothetical protein